MKEKYRLLIALTFFFLIPNLFFINKAIHLDDVPWLAIARQIIKDPLHPYSFSFNWTGVEAPIYDLADPPLVMYYLATVIKFIGDSEFVLHLSFLPFSILALLATFIIAKNFSKRPLVATMLVATAPAFFVSATSVMMDIPFLALSLLSIVSYFKSIHPKNHKKIEWVIITAFIAAGASLVKYTALAAIILIAFGYLTNRKFGYFGLFVMVVLLIEILWHGYFYKLYGIVHFIHISSLPTASAVFNLSYTIKILRGPYFLSFFGGSTVFVTPLLIISQNWLKRIVMLTLAAAYAYLPLHHPQLLQSMSKVNGILFLFFITNGSLLLSYILMVLISKFATKKEDFSKLFFLTTWLILGLIVSLMLSPFLNARYLLFVLVPLSILVSNDLDTVLSSYDRISSLVVWAVILVTLALSLMVAIADMRWANTIKSFVSFPFSISDKKSKIWYVGHWGLQYYVNQYGKSFLDISQQLPQEDDIILVPFNNSQQPVPDLSNSRLLTTIPLYHNWPVVTMSLADNAGWYSHHWGLLPFAISDKPVEIISVWQYRPSVASEKPNAPVIRSNKY